MTQRGGGPEGPSEDDLRLLARLEGRRLPRGRALAEALDMGPSAAWRFIRRMRRSGALRLVSPVKAPPDACECISYLRVHAVRADEIAALERRMAADPLVMDAAMITGWYDYRLFSRHSDYRSANAWSRSLEAAPGVAQVVTRMCQRMIERPGVAAAILGSG